MWCFARRSLIAFLVVAIAKANGRDVDGPEDFQHKMYVNLIGSTYTAEISAE